MYHNSEWQLENPPLNGKSCSLVILKPHKVGSKSTSEAPFQYSLLKDWSSSSFSVIIPLSPSYRASVRSTQATAPFFSSELTLHHLYILYFHIFYFYIFICLFYFAWTRLLVSIFFITLFEGEASSHVHILYFPLHILYIYIIIIFQLFLWKSYDLNCDHEKGFMQAPVCRTISRLHFLVKTSLFNCSVKMLLFQRNLSGMQFLSSHNSCTLGEREKNVPRCWRMKKCAAVENSLEMEVFFWKMKIDNLSL